jgi:hypothetical protein
LLPFTLQLQFDFLQSQCNYIQLLKEKNQEGKKCHYCKAHKMEKDWSKNIENINIIKHKTLEDRNKKVKNDTIAKHIKQ